MKSIGIMIAAALTFIAPTLGADQLTTDFVSKMWVGDVETTINEPTPDGRRIILPASFDNWNCSITSTFRSNNGSYVYRNTVCVEATTGIIIGVSTNCPIKKIGSDVSGFFLRSNTASIVLSTSCITHSVNTKNTTATSKL